MPLGTTKGPGFSCRQSQSPKATNVRLPTHKGHMIVLVSHTAAHKGHTAKEAADSDGV
jgi:hypothetical protein